MFANQVVVEDGEQVLDTIEPDITILKCDLQILKEPKRPKRHEITLSAQHWYSSFWVGGTCWAGDRLDL